MIIDKDKELEEQVNIEEPKKVKVSELAKELGMRPVELKEKLIRLGAPIKTTSSRISDEYVEKAKQLLAGEKGTLDSAVAQDSLKAKPSPSSFVFRSPTADTADEQEVKKPKRRFKVLDDGTAVIIKDEKAEDQAAVPSAKEESPEMTVEEEEHEELVKRVKDYEPIKPVASVVFSRKTPAYQRQAPARPPAASGRKHKPGARKRKKKKEKEISKKALELIRPIDELTDEEREKKSQEINICVLNTETIQIRDLAEKMGVSLGNLMKESLKMGIMITVNQEVDLETVKKLGERFGVEIDTEIKQVTKDSLEKQLIESTEIKDDKTNLQPRPPVITIMGHVDHGKTKLLDAIRKTNVVDTEAGGITQHIGAYQVTVHNKKLTFLDTPGHEAFTALRARGAQVTDIVILLVAADDGVMPQTIEAIDHAKAAGVPILVAINKIDKADANIDRVKQQLSDYELLSEEWGGKTVMCPISAKQEQGIEELLEMIITITDLEALKANPNKRANGIIIEAQLSKQRGPIATVLIKGGMLRKGDPFVIGSTYGKIRAMFDDRGKEVDSAGPSTPIEILGINEVPQAGDVLQVVESDKAARSIAEQCASQLRTQALTKKQQLSLENISRQASEGKLIDLNLVVKTDVRGSMEAIVNSLLKIKIETIKLNITHVAIGDVNPSDVMLAKASQAIILAFHVQATPEAQKLAEEEEISIRYYDIIYKLLEDIQTAMEGMLAPEFEEVYLGKAEVRTVFKSSKAGSIAGAYVTDGVIKRSGIAAVNREGKEIYKGTLETLRRFKDDAKEVKQNFECGIKLKNFEDVVEGDIITCFEKRVKS